MKLKEENFSSKKMNGTKRIWKWQILKTGKEDLIDG